MTVLIISSLEDAHARAVMNELAGQKVAAELLDLSAFPTRLALSMAFEHGARRLELVSLGGARLDLASIRAVWWRRPQPFGVPESLTDPLHRQFALSEATTAFDGLFQALDAFWVNDPTFDAAASHKPYQLALAQQIGLSIPPTLITNSPEEAKDFWRLHDGHVVYKQFRALPMAWRETRRLRAEEIALAENIRLAPVIFQRFVEAVADVRVTVIGDKIFAGSADTGQGGYPVDFRCNPGMRWVHHVLPPKVEDALRALMRRLRLQYGAIDMRLTADGEYVFLEINPAGQFLWIELETGQKIAAALAAHLANAKPTQARKEAPG